MDKRKRRYFNMIQSNPAPAGEAADSGAPAHVGAILRQRREELGYALPDLARTLRIRLPYLEAIEEGRWNDLPGHAYITGFLRTYAAALGLDPAPILTRFKQDTSGSEQPAELYFPEPVNESRVPSGALVIIALLLAGVAYGVWYTMGSSGQVAERVQDLPPRMAGLIPGGPQGTGPDTAEPEPEPAAVLPAGRVEELIGQSQPTGPEVGASTAPAGPGAPVLPPNAPSAALAGRTAGVTPAPAGRPADADGEAEESELPDLPPELSVPMTVDAEGRPVPVEQAGLPAGGEAADTTAPPAAPRQDPPQTAAGTPPSPAEAEGDGQAQQAQAGRLFGQTEGPVRVTIRAVEDSWIEVRDARGTLWAARNLRPGDVFRAPDVPGLTLNVVGNAAGVVLAVDGRELPPLGGRGQVVRDISLVPDDVAGRLNR